MEDSQIVALYWGRKESAIEETQRKYGAYCYCIAANILPAREDAMECVNDTYLAAWNSIPPNRPKILSTFLGKLTRRISIDRWRYLHAGKRGCGGIDVALDELSECIAGQSDPSSAVEARELAAAVSCFLRTQSPLHRQVFLMRYFQISGLDEICTQLGLSTGSVKSILHRTRGKLRRFLQKEGYL